MVELMISGWVKNQGGLRKFEIRNGGALCGKKGGSRRHGEHGGGAAERPRTDGGGRRGRERRKEKAERLKH
jgi:hypothetical protein